MDGYQRIVDEIHNLLSVNEQVLDERMRQLAFDYASVCREVNDRLQRCGEFLKQNLWSEAIHLADLEPKLIDSAVVLQFHERDSWEELLQMYELPRAPAIMMDIADELQDAYPRYLKIEKHLSVHRTLALKRAPLNRKLKVMREIKARDEGVPFWEDEIKELETRRFRQIEKDALAMAKRLDGKALNQLWEEVVNTEWYQRPPKVLVKRMDKLRKKVVETGAARRLPSITDQLIQHFDEECGHFQNNGQGAAALATDVAWLKAVQIHDQWYAAAEKAGLLENDPLFEQVAPILSVIQGIRGEQESDQNRRETLEELERGLVSPKMTRVKLQTLYNTASQWAPIPADVQEKVRRRMKQLWWVKYWDRVVGGVMFLIIVVVFVWFVAVVKK